MRETLLSKAKDAKSGEWVEGYYAYINSATGGRHSIIPKKTRNSKHMHERHNAVYEIDPATLCQCTGMRDSKGGMIFENDILEAYFPETVEDGPVYLRVVWDGCGFRTWQYRDDGTADSELADDLDCNLCIQATVAGNVFDGIPRREVGQDEAD
jgi:uncharacterized phage protein (TIGR01671 family)